MSTNSGSVWFLFLQHCEVDALVEGSKPPKFLSGSHRSTQIASDLASRALASQAKPQREYESQAFRIARS